MRQTADSGLQRNWKVGCSGRRGDTLSENRFKPMRKLIPALLLSLSLLAVRSAFVLPPQRSEAANSPTSSGRFLAQATAGPTPTSLPAAPATDPAVRGSPPLSLTLILLGLCCFFILLVGIFVLGFVVRNQSIREGQKDQQSKQP